MPGMRPGSFYRRNESRVMRAMGLVPTKGSGAGWIEKEDGQSEDLIAQLKSTDAESISVRLLDLHKLENNAIIAHKLPVFVIQFLKSEDVYMLVKPEYFSEVAGILEQTGVTRKASERIEPVIDVESEKIEPQAKIASGGKSRQKFWEKEQEKWQSKKRR